MVTQNRSAKPFQFTTHVIVLVVAAAVILSISMGLRQSLGLFQRPVSVDTGASGSMFGFALAVQSLVWGLAQPLIGMAADRFGARHVVIGSAMIYAIGLLLMATFGPGIGLNVGAGLLVGVGIAGTGFGVLFGAVARAVPENRRVQTLGTVSAAGSLATLLLAPAVQSIISSSGWRTGALVFAGIAVCMALLGLLLGSPSDGKVAAPEQSRVPVGEVVLAAMRHPGFMAMTAAFFACGFQLMYITAHLPAFLALCGVAPTVSATALAVIGLGNAAGSLIFGFLGTRHSQKHLLALAYLLRTITIVCFVAMPVSATSTILFAAAMGLLWLGIVPLVSALIVKLFGLQHFNTLFGVAFLNHQVGAFMGSWLGGVSVDMTGAYTMAWSGMIIIGLCAFLLQWFMDDQPKPTDRAPDRLSAAMT